MSHILLALCRHKSGHSCIYNVNICYKRPATLHTVHFIGHVGFEEATGAFLPQSLSLPGSPPSAAACCCCTSPVQAVLLTQAADPGLQSHTACSWSTTGSWRYLPLPESRQASNVCQWTSSKTWATTRLLNCCFCVVVVVVVVVKFSENNRYSVSASAATTNSTLPSTEKWQFAQSCWLILLLGTEAKPLRGPQVVHWCLMSPHSKNWPIWHGYLSHYQCEWVI